ncbi:MAG: 2OG-Fe(II) oxygenase, partial [Candidatus Competibacteraceae bacterium]|nr:2OG-Fe(II) oxygenase [Candidatus Competibacteraceae bacterium]
MSSITTELPRILSKVQRPGDFYTTGVDELFAPALTVDGVGPIALPLLPIQAEQLIAVAEQAPYGRGEETLVDTKVRRTWQIDAAQIHIEGRNWPRTLESIVVQAAEGLGVTQPVEAELYKLLVYDVGSFFVKHRDTEKAPGMFATLIIVLPSLYTGGELRVRHRDQSVQLDLRNTEPSEVSFAAFYADCVHEVLPITSGCRLTLVYNLLLRPSKKGRLPEPPRYESEQTALAKLLQQWAADKASLDDDTPDDDSPDDDSLDDDLLLDDDSFDYDALDYESPDDGLPEKLIYPLHHAYTPAGITFDALKGEDAAAASVLIAAAEQADCDLHLALISIEESGSAEYVGDYYYSSRRRGRYEEDEEGDAFEIGEIIEHSATLSEWRRPNGDVSDLGVFPFKKYELCPPDAFDDLAPDEQHFHEATGNAGATIERSYHRAGLVLWPRGRRLAVLNQAGLSATLPYLGELTQRWIESGKSLKSPLWQEAHELTGYMLQTWPRRRGGGYYWHTNFQEGQEARMLALLSQLRDTARIDTFLTDLSATGQYSLDDNAALVQAIRLLPAPRAAEQIESIIAGNVASAFGACANLLARCAALAQNKSCKVDFLPAAHVLVNALPGDPARAPQRESWYRAPPMEPRFVADFLGALTQLDAGLADAAVDYILAWPQTYGPDTVLVPASLILVSERAIRDGAAVRRLRAASLAHLGARIAELLEPPCDWTRPSTLACQCPHCTELSHFLADPDREKWTFKAVQATRSHVEDSIQRNECDLDRFTERQGRPYSLICTKNQASYERRVQQRSKDLKDVARLE